MSALILLTRSLSSSHRPVVILGQRRSSEPGVVVLVIVYLLTHVFPLRSAVAFIRTSVKRKLQAIVQVHVQPFRQPILGFNTLSPRELNQVSQYKILGNLLELS
jgi:hypothetical protein